MRILLVGAASRGSGAGRVARAIAEQLAPIHDVRQLALGLTGEPDAELPWVLEHARDPADWTGVGAAERWIGLFAPDAVIVLGEIELCIAYSPLMRRLGQGVVRVAYCSPAAPWRDPSRFRALSGFDCVVAFAQVAARALSNAFEALAPGDRPTVRVIPHGVDTDTFAPLPADGKERRGSVKRAVFRDADIGDDTVIFFNGNADWGCKQLVLTMRAFSDLVEEGAPDARLFVPGLSPDARRSAGHCFGLERELLFADAGYEFPIHDDAVLNRLYNACDVGISTSCRETWGLVAFEHAATGAPQLVPDAWVTREVWQGAAPLVEVEALNADFDRTYELYSPRAVRLREGMRRLYVSARARLEWGARARERALRDVYSWPSIGGRWRALLEDLRERG